MALLVWGRWVRLGIDFIFSEGSRWPASRMWRFWTIPFGREEAELDFKFLNNSLLIKPLDYCSFVVYFGYFSRIIQPFLLDGKDLLWFLLEELCELFIVCYCCWEDCWFEVTIPFSHVSSDIFPFWWVRMPFPCFWSLRKLPSYFDPFAHL